MANIMGAWVYMYKYQIYFALSQAKIVCDVCKISYMVIVQSNCRDTLPHSIITQVESTTGRE